MGKIYNLVESVEGMKLAVHLMQMVDEDMDDYQSN